MLSAGGTIDALIQAGHQVEIVTVFAGDYEAPLSEVAATYHAEWGITNDAVAVRCREDDRAIAVLGASSTRLRFLDAIYRKDDTGNWLIQQLSDTETVGIKSQQIILAQITDAIRNVLQAKKPDLLLGPSGLGRHVDHLLTSQAIRNLAVEQQLATLFWEDIPYVQWDTLPPCGLFTSLYLPLSEGNITQKILAAQFYASQKDMLWWNNPRGWNTIRDIAVSRANAGDNTGLAEVFWSLAQAPASINVLQALLS